MRENIGWFALSFLSQLKPHTNSNLNAVTSEMTGAKLTSSVLASSVYLASGCSFGQDLCLGFSPASPVLWERPEKILHTEVSVNAFPSDFWLSSGLLQGYKGAGLSWRRIFKVSGSQEGDLKSDENSKEILKRHPSGLRLPALVVYMVMMVTCLLAYS